MSLPITEAVEGARFATTRCWAKEIVAVSVDRSYDIPAIGHTTVLVGL